MLSAGIQGSLPKDFRPVDVSPLMPGKTVLWDHHPCGPPISLHFTLYQKPKVVIKDKILGLVSHGLEGRGGGITYANFSGSLAINGGSAGYGVTIYLKNIKETPCPVPVEGEIIAPVVFSWKSKGHIPWDMDHYQRALQNIYESCKGGSCLDLGKMFTIQVSCTMQGIKCDVAVEMCTVDTVFKAIPVPPMPVQSLLTDLYCDTSATGFITVDTQKQLHLIQENDPAACKLPLVGIWVKGICTVLHPLVWAACVRYISSTVYEQRLCLPPQPFLICLYNPLKHQPEFYDCISVLGNTWLTFGFERGASFTALAKVPIVDSKVTIAELTKMKEVPMGFNDAAKRIIQKKITSPNTMVITDSEDMPQLSHHPLLPKKINICPQVPEVSLLSEDGFDVPVSNVGDVDENHDVPVLSESDALHLNNTGKEYSDPMSAGDSLNVTNKSPMCGHEKAGYSNEDSAIEITETGVLNNSPMSSMMREEKSGSSQDVIRLPIYEVNTTEFEMYGNKDLRSENMQDDLQMCVPKSKECVPNGSESLANKYVTDHFVKVNSTKSNFNIAYSETSLKSRKCSSNIAKNGKDSFAVRCEQGITSELRPKNCVSKKSCLKKKTSSINSKNEEFGRTIQDSIPVQKNRKLSKDKSCASSVKCTQKVCYGKNPDAGGKKMLPKHTVTAKNAELTALKGTDQNCRVLQKSEHSSPSHDMCSCAHLQERLLTLEKQVNLLHGNHGKNSSDVSTTESERVSVNNVMNPVPPSEHSEDDSHLSLKYVLNHIKYLEGLVKDLAIKQTPHSQLDKSQVPVSTVNVPTLNPAPQTRTTPQHSPHNSYYSREHLVQYDLNGGACQVPGMSEMSSIHINRSAAVTVTDFTCPRNTPIHDGTDQNVTGPILQQCNLITTATMTSLVWPSYTKKCDNSAQTSIYIPDVSPATKQRDYTPIKASKSCKKKEKRRKVLPAETQVKNVAEKTNDEIQFVTPERAKVLPSHSFYKEKNTEFLDNDVQFSLRDIKVPTILDTNQSLEHSIHIEMEDYPATVYCPEMEKSSDENDDSSDTSLSQEEKRKGDAEAEYTNFVPDNAIIQDVIGNANKILQKQKTMEKNRLSLPEQQFSVQCYESERRYSENQNDEFHNRQRKKCAQPAGETSVEKVLEWKRSFVMRSRYPVSKRHETDLSMEVNVLADKYLSDKEEDEEPHGVIRSACAGGTWQSHKHSSDLSVYGIDSTNMSIATRKYLDRHQLRFSTHVASKQFFDDDRLDSSF